MESLWKIDEKLVEVFQEIAEADGELTPETEAKMSQLLSDRRVKVEKICYFIRSQERMHEALKKEAEHFSSLAKVRQRAAVRLKAYLLNEMKFLGEEKVRTDTVTVTRCKPGVPGVALRKGVALESLPEEFVEEIPATLKLNLKAVKERLKEEGKVPDEAGVFEVDQFTVTLKERLLIK